MTMIEVQDLRKYYGQGDTQVKALNGVSFSIAKGDFVSVVGTSGSGKSTLLNMLGGLDYPTSGQVLVDGYPIFEQKEEQLTIFRRRNIGFVFQDYNLLPILSVEENILLPLGLDGRRAEKDYLQQVVASLGLTTMLLRLPHQLSGGQQQRVAIARALITRPSIILADEPTGNLDSATSLDVLGLLKKASKAFAQTIVMITHNEGLAQMADYTLQIEDGKLVGESNA